MASTSRYGRPAPPLRAGGGLGRHPLLPGAQGEEWPRCPCCHPGRNRGLRSALSVRGAAGFPCGGAALCAAPGVAGGPRRGRPRWLAPCGLGRARPEWGAPGLSLPVCGFVSVGIGGAPRGSERFGGGSWRSVA